jgi:tetratricopeptide (TPR) repeat protein
MLDTVREYAFERLRESGDMAIVRHAQLEYYLALLKEAQPALYAYDANQAAWADRLEAERNNLRDLLAWCVASAGLGDRLGDAPPDRAMCAELGLRLAVRLARFWEIRGAHTEAVTWLVQTVAAVSHAEDVTTWTPEIARLRARALTWAGRLSYWVDRSRVAAFYRQALQLWRELGDTAEVGYTLTALAADRKEAHDLVTARALAEEGVALLRQAGDPRRLASGLLYLGEVLLVAADKEEALTYAAEAESLGRLTGSRWHVSEAKFQRMTAAYWETDYGTAQPACKQLLAMAREARDAIKEMICLSFLGSMAQDLGNYEEARSWHEACLRTRSVAGNKVTIGWSMVRLGEIARIDGDPARSRELCRQGLGIGRRTDGAWLTLTALRDMGYAELDLGEFENAASRFCECLERGRQRKAVWHILTGLTGLAAVAFVAGNAVKSARLTGATEQLIDGWRTRIPPLVTSQCRSDLRIWRGKLKNALTDSRRADALAEGRAMVGNGERPEDWDAAVEYALSDGE